MSGKVGSSGSPGGSRIRLPPRRRSHYIGPAPAATVGSIGPSRFGAIISPLRPPLRPSPFGRGAACATRNVSHRFLLALLYLSCAVSLGCASFKPPKEFKTEPIRLERGQLVFYTEVPLEREPHLVDELVQKKQEIETALKLSIPPSPIRVYLFDGPQKYQEYMRKFYPDLPPRRAYFLHTETRLVVYAQWGEAGMEDLRHEISHSYLHAAVPQIPLWLDEGLAEYFEVAPGRQGLNLAHLRMLRGEWEAGRWRPSLSRLERLTTLDQMTQLDYAESWAWVHWMLNSDPAARDVLAKHLARLGRGDAPPSLSGSLLQVAFEPEGTLAIHLDQLSRQDHPPVGP